MCFKKGFIINSLFIFSFIFIVLTGADFLTTTYALDNQLGYEANGIMSGIVNDSVKFIMIKILFTVVIIMLMSKCLKQSKKISHIGMRIIIFMMLFVVINNLTVISANALSFTNLSVYPTGSINNGNGYFDNPQSAFNYVGDRNVYVITESSTVHIIEPISWVGGITPTNYIAINSSLNTLKGGVVNNGYLYFVDGTTLKKKKTRDFTTPQYCESTDTTAGGCVAVMASGVNPTLRAYNNVLYYTTGMSTGTSGALWHLDVNDNAVSDFSFSFTPLQDHPGTTPSFAIFNNQSVLTLYSIGASASTTYLNKCTSSSCTSIVIGGATGTLPFLSVFATPHYIYTYLYTSLGDVNIEVMRRMDNGSSVTVDYITTSLPRSDRIYIGGASTIGLLTYDATTYQTFNSNEIGIDSLPVVPMQLTYTTKTVESLYTTYYNTSNFKISYNIAFDRFASENILLDSSDYRWQIRLIDPNGVEGSGYQTGACIHTLLGNECSISDTLEYAYPSNGWLAGTWFIKLYEVNIVNPNTALIATSQPFTVLNTSLENQTIVPNPSVDPNSGSGATALTIVDDWTAMFGLGVNPISKFMFAMMWIVGFAFFGFIATKYNLNGGIMMALFPFTFFIYIAYIPLWTVVIITMIVGMRLFR